MTDPTIDPKVYARIARAVMEHFQSGKELLEYEELDSLTKSTNTSKSEVASAVTLMSFGPSPMLKPDFYRLNNNQRIPVPADEVLSLISLRESNPIEWKNISTKIFIAWRLL